jgi:hypothetical protein
MIQGIRIELTRQSSDLLTADEKVVIGIIYEKSPLFTLSEFKITRIEFIEDPLQTKQKAVFDRAIHNLNTHFETAESSWMFFNRRHPPAGPGSGCLIL